MNASIAAQRYMTMDARIDAYAAGMNLYNQMAESTQTGSTAATANGESSSAQESGAGDVKYSLKEADDGSKYVEVDTDQDIFEGHTSKEYPKIVREYFKNHFRGTVLGTGSNRAYVDARSEQEYTNPAKRVLPGTFDAKMKAGPELNHLLSASTYTGHNANDGRHPEFSGGFDWYDVTFKVGDEWFSGRINVGIDEKGRRRFYDLTQIKSIDRRIGVKQQTNVAAPSRDLSSVNSIAAGSESVKEKNTAAEGRKRSPGIVKKYTTAKWNTLDAQQKQTATANMAVVEALAKRTGRTIEIVDELRDKKGRKVNATYDPRSGQIRVAMDADGMAYAYAAAHELTHAMKNEHSGEWEAFSEYVLDTLRKSGEDVDALIDHQMEQFGYSREDALEEVVCNTVPAMLQDESNLFDLYKGNRTLFERVVDWVKGMLTDVKAAGEQLAKRSKSWAQMDALKDRRAELQTMYDRMMDVMSRQAEESTERSERYNLSDKEGTEIALSQQEAEDNRRIAANMDPVVKLEGNPHAKNPDKDFLNMGMEYFTEIGGKATNPILGDISLDSEGLRHLISQKLTSRKTAMLRAIKPVLENGQLIYIDNNHKGRGFDTGLIAAPVEWNGEPYYAGVVVKQNGNAKNSYYMHDAVFVQKNRTTSLNKCIAMSLSSDTTTGDPIAIILAELADYNKNFSGDVEAENNGKYSMSERVEKTDAIQKENADQVGVYYWKKSEARSLLEGAGIQFPRGSIQDSLNHSIFDAGSPVNRKFIEQTETRVEVQYIGNTKGIEKREPSGKMSLSHHNHEGGSLHGQDNTGSVQSSTDAGVFRAT